MYGRLPKRRCSDPPRKLHRWVSFVVQIRMIGSFLKPAPLAGGASGERPYHAAEKAISGYKSGALASARTRPAQQLTTDNWLLTTHKKKARVSAGYSFYQRPEVFTTSATPPSCCHYSYRCPS
jgi:hypothetical protein